MNRAMRLAIELASSAKTAGFDAVKTAAKGAAAGVAEVGRQTKITSDATDHMATVSSTATGALGALGSGLELVGLGGSGAAAALQSTAMATDFMSGVTDLATLALESEALASLRGRAATLAHAAASKASAAAQWALNAAMSANPIMLVVIATAALVAGFVIAYKKSEAFRAIVQAAGRAGQAAIGWIVDRVASLVSWLSDKVGPAWDVLTRGAGKAFDFLKRNVGPAFDAITHPIQTAIDLVQRLIDWIKRIKIPDLGKLGDLAGKLNPFGRAIAGSTVAPSAYVPVDATAIGPGEVNYYTFNVYVSGVLDADDAGETLLDLLNRWSRARGGGAVVFA